MRIFRFEMSILENGKEKVVVYQVRFINNLKIIKMLSKDNIILYVLYSYYYSISWFTCQIFIFFLTEAIRRNRKIIRFEAVPTLYLNHRIGPTAVTLLYGNIYLLVLLCFFFFLRYYCSAQLLLSIIFVRART